MPIQLLKRVPLANYTTFHVGGEAEYLYEASTEDDVINIIEKSRADNIPLAVIGGGSNVLIPDEGLLGIVLVVRSKGITIVETADSVLLTAAAGEIFDDVVSLSVSKGWWGIENLSHIPGSVGAAPVQNIGAYGVEVESCVDNVAAVNIRTSERKIFSNNECSFGYRDSFFKTSEGKNWVITSVTFRLKKNGEPKIEYADLQKSFSTSEVIPLARIRDEIITIRSQKFPDWNTVGTAGSFFKNPVITKELYKKLLVDYPGLPSYITTNNMAKIPLGWVLDKICGLKGYVEGNVSCYEKQALVIVAKKGATSHEIKNFATNISKLVFSKTNISIEWEVTLL